jgi:hypothetical protein
MSLFRVDAAVVARAGWGCALMFAPDRVLRIGGRPPAPPAAVAVARVLATRHLAQALVTAAWPAGWVADASAAVDALHAGTDVGFAAVSARWRRIVLIDAAIAAALAASDRRTARADGGFGRWRG